MSTNYYPRFKNILGLCFATLALCLAGQKAMAQPTISSVSPGLGIGGVTSVTITGTNFSATAANDTVFFGATRATVTLASTTSLTVTVPVGAIYAPVSVLNTATRLTGYQGIPFLPRFDTACFVNNQLNFQPKVDFTATANPIGICISDVDGDGKPDVIICERTGANKIAIYRNTSASGSISISSLAAPVQYATVTGVTSVKAIDLDGDGKPEIITCGPNTPGFDVFRNLSTSGTVSFAARRTYTSLAAPFETVIADFDGDGRPDVAVLSSIYDSVSVFRNLITTPGAFVAGSFATKISFGTGHFGKSLCAADIDGDGKPDIITSNDAASTISVLRNAITSSGALSSTSFSAKVDFATGISPQQVLAGDIDGDGKPEIIVADSGSNAISVFYNTATSGSITSSSFAAKVDFTADISPMAFGIGDLNGDGKLDIVASNSFSGDLSVFRNTTTGTGAITSSSFATATSLSVGLGPVGVAIGDIDGDTRPEVMVCNSAANTISLFHNYPLPLNDTVTGADSICASTTSAYANTISGGVWAITSHTGSVISTSGVVTAGTTAGNDTVTYTITCAGDANIASKPITIINAPTVLPITGPSSVCVGDTIHLADATLGGTWGNTLTASVATVDTAGIVTGVSSGPATITYAKATACGVVSSYYNITVNTHPGAIVGPSSICVGTTVTLTSSPGGGNWNSSLPGVATITSGGSLHGAGTGVTVISYTIPVTGCRSTDTITVTSLPSAITGTDTLCVGISSILHDAGTGTWASASTGVATIDSVSGLVTGIASGTSVIRFGVTGSGCYALDTVVVNPVGAPVLSISSTPATGICAGTVVTYMANTTSGGTSPTFVWTVNGSPAGSGPTITYIPANGDLIVCKLFSNSPCVNPDTVSRHVIVSLTAPVLPTVTIHTTGTSGDTVCSGNPTTLNATFTNGGATPQFEWYVNHVPVGFGTTLSYTPANGDIVNIYLESSVACPAIDTARDTVVLHVVPYATPTVTMDGSSIICQGYPAIFYADATFPGAAPIYDWTVNGVITSTLNPLSYMPTSGDVVQLTLTSNYPCLTFPVAVSGTTTLTVVPVFLPNVSVSASATIVLPGFIMPDTFIATITNGGAAPDIQWYNNSTPVPGATTTRFITTAITGRDSITCRVINTDLCNDISVYDYAIVNVGLNIGVQQVNNDHSFVSIVPNPNSGSFILKGDLGVQVDEEMHIEITNMLGQVAYAHTLHASRGLIEEHVLPDNDLGAGTYLLTLHSDHMNKVVRFTVEK